MGSLLGGGGGKATVGYRYYMTLFMALCRGPIDSVEEIRIGDRVAWPRARGHNQNQDPINDTGSTDIKAGDLFGGDKREGGVEGPLRVYMGKPNQSLPDKLKNLIGGRVPDMRGVVTMWFDGLICSLNPYPKPWAIRVRRTINGWNGRVWQPKLAVVWLANRKIKSYNAAHILYEASTNYDWGRNLDRAELDDKVWTDTAKRLKAEGMGLCFAYRRDGDLDEFVENVLKHIGGTLYTDRASGLLCLKLIRKDYNPKDLKVYGYDTGLIRVEQDDQNVPVTNINEVIVKYKSPIANKEREARAQNLAGIQQIGRNSVSIDYSGFSTHSQASRAAQRDLRAMSVPERYKIVLDRRAWQEFPGSVFRISAPDRDLSDVIIRAGNIEYQSVDGEEQIIIDGALDVFGLPASEFVSEQDSEYVEPEVDPATIVNYLMRELTYQEFVVNADRYTVDNLESTDAALAVFAVRPLPMALNYNILSRAGVAEFTGTSTQGFVPSALLVNEISAYDEDFEIYATQDPDSYEEGMLIQIDQEMMRVNTFTYDEETDTGSLNVSRGIIDTIPSPHALNARFYTISDLGTDLKDWLASDVVDVKLQTVTSSAVQDETTVPTLTITMTGRQAKPYAPGNVRVNATPIFSGVTMASEPALSVAGGLLLEWNHRDRISQQDVIIPHEDGNVGPEPGTQYKAQIVDGANVVQMSATISGTSWNPSLAGLAAGTYWVKLAAERDAIQSRAVYSRKIVK